MPVYDFKNPDHKDMAPAHTRFDNAAVDTWKRNDLIAKAKIRYPNISGKAWFSAPNSEVKLALKSVSGYVPDNVLAKHNEWKHGNPSPKPKPKTEPKADPNTKGLNVDGLTQEQVSALLQIMQLLSPKQEGIDEEAVRKIVRAMLAEQVTVPVTITNNATKEITKVEGQHRCFPQLLQAIDKRLSVMLFGPPGTSKSYSVKAAAEALDLAYAEVSCSPTLTKFDLIGHHDVNGRYVETPFRRIWEHGGVFLVDEADNSNGQETAVLNNGMANGHMAFPDGVIPKHGDCVVVMAANTVGMGATREYTGRQALDGPLRDRLLYMHWPIDEALEQQILTSYAKAYEVDMGVAQGWMNRVLQLRKAAEKSGQVRVVVSPRATINGVPLLSCGWTHQQLEETLIWKGADAEVRKKIIREVV